MAPVDPSIVAGLRGPQIPSPLQTLQTFATVQDIQERTEARRLAGEEARQKAMDASAIRRIMQESGGDWEKALPQLRMINPSAAVKLETDIGEARNKSLEGLKTDLANQMSLLDVGIKIAQNMTPENYPQGRRMLFGLSKDAPRTLGPLFPETYDPVQNARVIDMALSRKDQLEQQQKGVDLFTKGDAVRGIATYLSSLATWPPDQAAPLWDGVLQGAKQLHVPQQLLDVIGPYSPENMKRIQGLTIAPEKQAELAGQAAGRAQTAAHQTVLEQQGAERIQIARQRAQQPSGSAQTDHDDVEAIADAIINGEQPPTLTGLYRYAAPIRGALARKGFNLANAQSDWTATQRHFTTLNGAQQTRLRQAVDTAIHSLDVIDTLAGRWQGGQFPVLNRVNLAAAKHGVYGQQAASIAQQLEAQISDLTSELGNAYMGGNSPTDHALQLAAKNLSADWSEKVLKDMTALARTNLQIRQNAIKNTGVIGATPQNPYAPPPPADPLVVTAPNGRTYRFHTAAEAAAFKKRAGIP